MIYTCFFFCFRYFCSGFNSCFPIFNEIFFKKIDGFTHSSLDTFTQQLLDGQLHDINRIEDVILKLKDNDCDVYSQRWINDYALVKLLRYYYNKCIDLEIKLKLAEDKNIVDSIIYKK